MKRDRKILNTVSIHQLLDYDQLIEYNLGIEFQDFTEPRMTQEMADGIIAEYKEILKDFKGIKAMHGPFIDLKPSSPDIDIAQASKKKYRIALRAARELELDYIVFHSQINPNHIGEAVREYEEGEARKFWHEIMEEFSDFKGKVVLENVFEKDPRELKSLLDAIDLDNVKVNLDIGHARLGDYPLEDWIRELREYIVYMHIHSNDGKVDYHDVPEAEEIEELYRFLDKYDLNPVLSLEYKIDDMAEEIKKYR